MATPNELVTDAFAQARNYALTAEGQLAGYLANLASAVTVTPLVDVSFQPVEGPGTAVAPTYIPPTEYVLPNVYDSPLLGTLQSTLSSRLAGGTGLSASVETALWDRARERELAAAQAGIDQVMGEAESLGWDLPVGVLADGVRREQRAYYDKAAALSRDIAIKQAELEQSNLNTALAPAVQLEAALIDSEIKIQGLAVDAKTKLVAAAVGVFNAEVARFRAEIEQDVKHWEAGIKQYEAQITYTMNAQKLNADIMRSDTNALLEAGKVGAQVYGQLTAAAYSIIGARASVSADSGMRVSYSYGNDTATAAPTITSI